MTATVVTIQISKRQMLCWMLWHHLLHCWFPHSGCGTFGVKGMPAVPGLYHHDVASVQQL